MKEINHLSELNWKLVGTFPYENYLNVSLELGTIMKGEMDPIDVKIPCSVQKSLLDQGMIEDWNHGDNSKKCEWIENRFWIFVTEIPKDWFIRGNTHELYFEGLDYNGEVYLGDKKIHEFNNSLIEHVVKLEGSSVDEDQQLKVIFHTPPRWLGQFGYTSQIKDFKPRFYYWWDWTSRIVQTGITGDIKLNSWNQAKIDKCLSYASIKIPQDSVPSIGEKYDASIKLHLEVSGSRNLDVSIKVESDDYSSEETRSLEKLIENPNIDLKNIEPWWPHGIGEQKLYQLTVSIIDKSGNTVLDTITRKIGFRTTKWTHNKGATHADAWIFNINNQPVFLTGVNWTPIKPNYADTTREEYKTLLLKYKYLGIRLLRVWGGAYLEREDFYELCDELGFLVWQEFPLSSSGLDNCPPEDEPTIKEHVKTAKSYIERRHFHASHIMWCGGNELREFKTVHNVPVSDKHPLIREFKRLVEEMDPSKRFIPSTPCGPEFNAKEENMGKGLHWAVNGPWTANGKIEDHWTQYFNKDDSLIRTEIGAPGPSDVSIIIKYKGKLATTPCDNSNDLWRRQSWWTEADQFEAEKGYRPENLEEYVKWGQKRQKDALLVAAECCLKRFPECGGIIFWMGHDSFPCAANTSLIDFEGNPKPAMLALADLWKKYDSIINPKREEVVAV